MNLTVLFHDHHHPLSLLQRALDGLSYPCYFFWVDNNAVDYHFDVVDLVTIDLHLRRDVQYLAIDTDLGVARFANLYKQLTIVSFSSFYHRGKQRQFGPVVVL